MAYKMRKPNPKGNSALKQTEATSPAKNYSLDWGGDNLHNRAHAKHNAGKGGDPHAKKGEAKAGETRGKETAELKKKEVAEFGPEGQGGDAPLGMKSSPMKDTGTKIKHGTKLQRVMMQLMDQDIQNTENKTLIK